MEERISLALAVKLKKMFEREDLFLSIPPVMAFPYDSLKFMEEGSGLSAKEQLKHQADFARIMNVIPEDGSAVFTHSDSFLWDEMKNILINADFAESTLTQQEQSQLDKAIDFLTDKKVDDNGFELNVYSSQYQLYDKYSQIYHAAEKSYLNEEEEFNSFDSQDEKEADRKIRVDRKEQLESAKKQAMTDWINLGYKNQVETHQNTRNLLESKKSPLMYRQDYLEDIDLAGVSDIESRGVEPFCVTLFSPCDSFDTEAPWIEVSLTKQEINKLVNEASDDLKKAFDASNGTEDIESVTFEYKYVDIRRPWFKPAFFQSKCWKMPDDEIVSDGQIPRTGSIPAYISGFLAARKITIVKKKASQNTPIDTDIFPIMKAIHLQKFEEIEPLKATKFIAASKTKNIKPRTVRMAGIDQPMIFSRVLTAKPIDQGKTTKSPKAPLASREIFSKLSMHKLKPMVSRGKPQVMKTLKVNEDILRPDNNMYLKTMCEGITLKTPKLELFKLTLPKKPEMSDSVHETCKFNGVVILAFACKRVPKAPDHDPGLQW